MTRSQAEDIARHVTTMCAFGYWSELQEAAVLLGERAWILKPLTYIAALEVMAYAWTGRYIMAPLTPEYWLQGFPKNDYAAPYVAGAQY